MFIPEPQYIESIRKGDTVIYGNKPYRVQDDGRGFLHIIVFDGKRRKIALEDIRVWFDYGTKADYAFNQWWRIYPDYETFRLFSEHEIMEVTI